MRSQELPLERYQTDKINQDYLQWYDTIFSPLVDREIKLLELGIYRGGSLRLWRDYFPKATITGIDLQVPADLAGEERIMAFAGDQGDTAFLTSVAEQAAPHGFDIIIDDASHIGSLTKTSFWHLFDHHLKPGGLYFIEDWGTGYFRDWPDGKAYRPRSRAVDSLLALARRLKIISRIPAHSHAYGLAGFVKELVDEQASLSLTGAQLMGGPSRPSKFASMTISPWIVLIKKAAGESPADG